MRIVQLMLLCFGVVLLTACGFGGSGSPAYFQIGGTLRGLSANQSVTLTNNHGKPLTLRANGNFQFAMPVAYGSSYSITVAQQPAGQICSVAAESGTRAGIQSNVDSIQIVCSTQPTRLAALSAG